MSLISRRASYGLRTMFRLAERAAGGRGATIAWLAENEHLPRKYLEQVLRDLKQAGLVDSRSGPNGGCRLARPATEITVGDVIRALDGELRPGHCMEEGHAHDEADCPGCWGLDTCAMREVWVALQAAMNRVLDGTTIADLGRRQAELTAVTTPNYQI
jgi:Rrf2 family protein